MNCRSFERQTADWLSRRLPPEQSEEMAAHRETCPACARAAAAEARLHGLWREGAAASPVANLWPRVVAGLDAPAATGAAGKAPGRDGLSARSGWPGWALVASVALGTFVWAAFPHARTPAGPPPARTAAPIGPAARPPDAPRDPWTALRDVAQSDPLVDDPAGANMEDTWTCLDIKNK